jgi:hypothetical protein
MPDDLNAIFNEFARVFVGTIKDKKDVAFATILDRKRLDGSAESLHEVDRYLGYLHQHHELRQPARSSFVVLA